MRVNATKREKYFLKGCEADPHEIMFLRQEIQKIESAYKAIFKRFLVESIRTLLP